MKPNGKDEDFTNVFKCAECGEVTIGFSDWCLHCGYAPQEEDEEPNG